MHNTCTCSHFLGGYVLLGLQAYWYVVALHSGLGPVAVGKQYQTNKSYSTLPLPLLIESRLTQVWYTGWLPVLGSYQLPVRLDTY